MDSKRTRKVATLCDVRSVRKYRVAVGIRLGDDVGRDVARGPGAVVDDHLLAEQLRELMSDRARGGVGAAAGREADDHSNGFDRVILGRRLSRCGEQRGRQGRACELNKSHDSSWAAMLL